MKTLIIRWQRLVNQAGKTCPRCSDTGVTVEAACNKLKKSLGELDIEVVLKKETLNFSIFTNDPLQSNRIWIGDKPLEKWLRKQHPNWEFDKPKNPIGSTGWDLEVRRKNKDLLIEAKFITRSNIASVSGLVTAPLVKRPQSFMKKKDRVIFISWSDVFTTINYLM